MMKIDKDKLLFTADEHFFHFNILKFSNRPFRYLEEMHEELIGRHNEIANQDSITYHLGDFSFRNREHTQRIIEQLKGQHVFLRGSHDGWLKGYKGVHEILDLVIEKQPVTLCHYNLRTWHRSHYNSFLLYGHSHGSLPPIGKQIDVGVDTNNYYPYTWQQIVEIMKTMEDNPNLIRR